MLFSKKKCTCGDKLFPKTSWTSQDYDARYKAMIVCPVHSKVPDRDTKRYELTLGKKFRIPNLKGCRAMEVFAVMQAVALGRDGQVGIKLIDTQAGYRVISSFLTREDARAYLLEVLDTVKREKAMGIRSKRNLDPTYEGGLDFQIQPAIIVIPMAPLKARGWKLPTSDSSQSERSHGKIKGRFGLQGRASRSRQRSQAKKQT